MGKKYLKRYNKETRKWEMVSAPDINTEARLPDGSQITDNDVRITNGNYAEETTLNGALDTINEDLSRLKRNVSWLDAHKGEGGSGGGGGGTSYKIMLISPTLVNGNVYVKKDSIDVEFMISGPSEDNCSYTYVLNGKEAPYSSVSVNTPVVIRNIVLSENEDFHTFSIRAKNPYNITITPVGFNIYKSKIDLAFNEAAVASDYVNQVLRVKTGSQTSRMPFIITNGIQGATINVNVTANTGQQKNFEIKNAIVGKINYDINFWDIVNKENAQVGYSYVLDIQATSTKDGYSVSSDIVKLRIKIISSDSLVIVAGVNGVDASGEDVEPVVIESNSNMRYNFKVYAPQQVINAYYAVKLENKTKGQSYLILGNYFDDGLKKPEANSYVDNNVVSIGSIISSQYAINDTNFSEDDVVSLYVRAWGNGVSIPPETVEQKIVIGKVDNTIFPKQIPSRFDGQNNKDTLFLSFNRTNAEENNKYQWVSVINNYNFLASSMGSIYGNTVISTLNLYNGNTSSGIIANDGVPYMRFQNHSYGVCDLSAYEDEILLLTNTRDKIDGFTISVTFEADATSGEKDTVLLWGENDAVGNFISGIKIQANTVYWYIDTNRMLTAKLNQRISTGKKKTIDFCLTQTQTKAVAKIYVDGTVNCAETFETFSDSYRFSNLLYFGTDYVNSTFTNFAKVKLYDFSIYSKPLNDIQIVSNAKNAQIDRENESDLEQYNQWKIKNFISASSGDEEVPESLFLKNGEYVSEFSQQNVLDIAAQSNIPTLMLSFDEAGNFKKTDFFIRKEKGDTAVTYPGVAKYYDPDTKITEDMAIRVAYQGTTTLTYRVKNLELYMADTFVDKNGEVKTKLFQPKKEWFPESQFTLKADVVDSAHANNAVLGEWINKCNYLEPNPAMAGLSPTTRPKDVNDSGVIQEHEYEGNIIDYNEQVTIKHTLEGFPILLFIQFSDSEAFTFVGIYSFNLGRFSYYNMGLKFLKNFSRRDANGDIKCPKIINYYETMDSLGDAVNSSQCYSFEFDNPGNQSIREHPVWSQFDKSIIQTYGEFKYPIDITAGDDIWNKLSELFNLVAHCPAENYYGNPINLFTNIHEYVFDSEIGDYRDTGRIVETNAGYAQQLKERLNINNAITYFIIANAFGMTDSLGKNLVLRTWDGGNTWYTCFYDMDTALGLSNKGAENVPTTACVDKIYMVTDSVAYNTRIVTDYHYENASQSENPEVSDFAAAMSKLWGILRDTETLYNLTDRRGVYLYETCWNTLRKNGGLLAKASNFIEMMETRIKTCGEIVYNCDYYQKYILFDDNANLDSAIQFLHGTRIDYVNDWLKKHFSFLDGVFSADLADGEGYIFTESDSTFNNNDYTAGFNFNVIKGRIIPFVVRVNTPSFIAISIDENRVWKKYYIESADTDTVIYIKNDTSSSSLIEFKGAVTLTKLEGLQGSFMSFGTAGDAPFRSLKSFDVSGSQNLYNNTKFETSFFLHDGESPLEEINYSNTGNKGTITNYQIDLTDFTNLLSVNIRNSEITGLVLPPSSLDTLLFDSSNLSGLRIRQQNRITSLDFTNCKKMTSVEVSECSAVETLTFAGMDILQRITIDGCSSLSSIVIRNCNALSSVTISRNNVLENIDISEINNTNGFNIVITEGKLKTIKIAGSTCSSITLPQEEYLTEVESVDFSDDVYLTEIRFGYNPVEKYSGSPVFDLSKMGAIKSFSLANVYKMKYLRLPNNEEEPFNMKYGKITGCRNLVRIFGHILLSEGTFQNLYNYYINDWDKSFDDYSEEEWADIWNSNIFDFNNSNTFTNISISNTGDNSLSYCFIGTSCSALDVIYVFKKINGSVTSLNSTFNNCGKLITTFQKSLPNEIFDNCSGVTSIAYLFYLCEGLETKITSHMLESLLGDRITQVDNVFRNCKLFAYYDEPLFYSGNVISYLSYFSPYYYDYDYETGSYSPADVLPENVLKNLENVETIHFSFNDIRYMGYNAKNGFKLLYKCKKLKRITYSFNSFVSTDEYAEWDEGNGIIKNILGERTSDYPKLEFISYSFNGESSYYEDDESVESKGQRIYIGNSFLGNSYDTIERIQGSFMGLIKKIDFRDTDSKTFPYQIFKGCTKLETVMSLFEGMDCKLANGEVNENVVLPGSGENSMFSDCRNLKNIEALFANMKNIHYTLSGNGFVHSHCSLENVSRLFENIVFKSLVGMVPFNLFRLEDSDGCVKATITNMDGVFESCNSEDLTCYTFDGTDTDLWEYYRNSLGDIEKRWNPYVFDGTRDFWAKQFGGKTISQIKTENNLGDIPEEFTQNYVSGVPFVYDYNNTDIGGKYDKTSETYLDYTYSECEKIFSKDNYFCPPDIFKYCDNSMDLSVNTAFENTSTASGGMFGKIPPFIFRPISNVNKLEGVFRGSILLLPYEWGRETGEDTYSYGARYPEDLFGNEEWQMPNLTNVTRLFADNRMWGKTETNFSIFPSTITQMEATFYLCDFISRTSVFGGDLHTLKNLRNVSGMLSYSNFVSLPVTKFIDYINNPNISNCSDFMRYSNTLEEGSCVPELWKYNFTRSDNYKGAFGGVSEDVQQYISNQIIGDTYWWFYL